MNDSLRVQLLKFLGVILVILALIAGYLRWQHVDVVTVATDAMAPTMFAGDQVLVWRTREFDHGEMILCRHPRREGAWIIGRILGRPGMTVELGRGDQFVINGQTVTRDFQGVIQAEDQNSHAMVEYAWGIEELGEVDHLFMHRQGRRITMRPIRNSPGFYLVSDNRSWMNEDSRTLGPSNHLDCFGVVFMRLSPGGRAPAEVPGGWFDILD